MRSDAVRIPLLRWLARHVAGWSDAGLERVFGNRLMLWLLFVGMARSYQPSVVPGWAGTIAFRVSRPLTDGAELDWAIDVYGSRAVASAGPADGAGGAIHVSATVADLIRVATGLIDPGEAILAGGLNVDEYRLGAMIPEMFGTPPLR